MWMEVSRFSRGRRERRVFRRCCKMGIGAVGDAEGGVDADIDDEEVARGARKCVRMKDPCTPS